MDRDRTPLPSDIQALVVQHHRAKRRVEKIGRSIDRAHWIVTRLPDWAKPVVRWTYKARAQRYERATTVLNSISREIRARGFTKRELGL